CARRACGGKQTGVAEGGALPFSFDKQPPRALQSRKDIQQRRAEERGGEGMELQVEKAGDVTVVVPKAEFLDANTSREVKDELPAALSDAGKVVLDLHHVQFMDSGGCGAVLAVLKKLKT